MTNRTFHGVILAAGKGSRMAPFSAHYPKPILPICNKPLIQYQIEYMKRIGIEDVIVVVGHLGYEISRHLGDGEKLGVKIRYFEQKSALGIAHALGQVEEQVGGPFLLVLGDTFFIMDEQNALNPLEVLVVSGAKAVLTVIDNVPTEKIRRSFCVVGGGDRPVKRVIEKPRHAPTSTIGTGIYCFDLNIFDAIRRTPRTAMRDEYEITDAIQILIDDGLTVLTTGGVLWCENVTFPEDILRCNSEMLAHEGRESAIGANVTLHPEAVVRRSSIGDNASLALTRSITNSVILSGVEHKSNGRIAHSIVTPDTLINLSHVFEKSE